VFVGGGKRACVCSVYGGNLNSETVCSLGLPVIQLVNQGQPCIITVAMKMRRKYGNLIIEEVNKILSIWKHVICSTELILF
jgi:hypothetical protein